MEASALTHASRRGLLARRSPLLKLQGDARLIAMVRSGNAGAFETIVDRYQGRLLGFCRQMLGSTEDAEDVLQEVFVNAYRAMLADEREINLRPWLYRIARNRCLNHLRKPTADAQESMDMVPAVEAASTAERVHNREEFRQLLCDVGKLPETQRSALLLREMDALSYEEIAQAMDTSVPSVKSLLVRARISLAEASQARLLTCGEVRLELAEAAEGLRKVSGPIRRHVRDCEECSDFRSQIRSTDKALAALAPVGPLVALKSFFLSKLGFGGGGAAGTGAAGSVAGGAASSAAGAAGAAGASGAVGAAGASVGAALSGSGAASGIGAVGGALGTKAVAGVVTAAVITAGAVEVKPYVAPESHRTPIVRTRAHPASAGPTAYLKRAAGPTIDPAQEAVVVQQPPTAAPPAPEPAPAPESDAQPAPHQAAPPSETAPPAEPASPPAAQQPAASGSNADEPTQEGLGVKSTVASSGGAPPAGETVVVTVGGSSSPPPPPAEPASEATTEPPPPSAEEEAPVEEEAAPPPPAEAPPAE